MLIASRRSAARNSVDPSKSIVSVCVLEMRLLGTDRLHSTQPIDKPQGDYNPPCRCRAPNLHKLTRGSNRCNACFVFGVYADACETEIDIVNAACKMEERVEKQRKRTVRLIVCDSSGCIGAFGNPTMRARVHQWISSVENAVSRHNINIIDRTESSGDRQPASTVTKLKLYSSGSETDHVITARILDRVTRYLEFKTPHANSQYIHVIIPGVFIPICTDVQPIPMRAGILRQIRRYPNVPKSFVNKMAQFIPESHTHRNYKKASK
jgi:hypothetical protein